MTTQPFRSQTFSCGNQAMVYLKPLNDGTPSGEKYPQNTARIRSSNTPLWFSHQRQNAPVTGGLELTIDDRFANRLAFDSATTSRIGIDELLKANERAAAIAFNKTIETSPAPALSVQFTCRLGESIIPKLAQIGMDARLALELFRIGGQAWQLMSPYLNKNNSLHPIVLQDIKTVHEGIRRKADETADQGAHPQRLSIKEQMRNVNSGMAPENLQGLLGQITTPWIILPRAYNALQKNQCHYLPIYLQFIDKNDHAACNRVFTRIVIELVANFSTKFADHSYSPVILKNVVFHAYESMFWRSLRCPPSGFEDCRIFETVLNFLIRHAGKGCPTSAPMTKAILRMQTAKDHIFPQELHKGHQLDPSRFLITLRHGAPEIGALLRYFEHMLKMDRNAQGCQQNSMALLKSMSGLIREVGKKYRQENQRTRLNIRQFFKSLRWVFADKSSNKTMPAVTGLDPSRFRTLRIVRMIDGLMQEF